MAVNLSKNRLDLLTAYQDVINETSPTDWALYTYEDNSNDLRLASSGGGGLHEITMTFDHTRVMYGFCSLKEPSATLPSYVFINWVGEDVPDARKCACASHVATIAEFFQGVDVIVNASSVEDIDPSAIGQRLTNGMATVTSPVLNRLRMRDEENIEAVGTCYQKTNAEIEMKRINREEFWEQAKREEEMRKEEEQRKAVEERKRFEEERMELERREQEERERRYREREQQIEECRRKLQTQEEEETRERMATIVTKTCHEDAQEKRESEVEEAAAIIAKRAENPREFFRQREKAMACSFDSSQISLHRKGRLNSPFLKLQYSLPDPSPPLLVSHNLPCFRLQPGKPECGSERNAETVQAPSIPKIVTTPIQEEAEDESRDEWECEAMRHVPESGRTQFAQGTALQERRNEEQASSERGASQQETVCMPDLSETPPSCAASPVVSHPMELTEDAFPLPEPLMAGPHSQPQPLLSFSESSDHPAAFCEDLGEDDGPSSLVNVAGQHQMTLSYQHALEHASGTDSQDLDDGQLLMSNGEVVPQEGTQASEGYFSQSQEEEFAQTEEGSAKETPVPVFYHNPPEIDITCWDTDSVTEEYEYGVTDSRTGAS